LGIEGTESHAHKERHGKSFNIPGEIKKCEKRDKGDPGKKRDLIWRKTGIK
jgi:hypothetical protein